MTLQQMRMFLKAIYPKSVRWQNKVDRMTDHQVVAVMIRIRLKDRKKAS